MVFCAMTSNPIVGSSKNKIRGRCKRLPMISIFMRSPSDRRRN